MGVEAGTFLKLNLMRSFSEFFKHFIILYVTDRVRNGHRVDFIFSGFC